jgi:hypothetical protein
MKHEVIDHKLASAGEEIRECLLAIAAFERILFCNGFPWQFANLTAQLIALAREFLFLLKQRSPRGQPLVMRYNAVIHGRTPV